MSSKNGQKDPNKKKVTDEDETPTRAKVREFVEGKYITLIMTFLTLFALFGDDFRLWFFDKGSDPYFFGVLTVSLVLFALEILFNACVLDDFKYSFFFWLDIIATASLIPDIDFLVIGFYSLLGKPSPNQSVDVAPGQMAVVTNQNDKLTKIIKSLRLIRLIRIIKLYKYLVKSSTEAEEARLREQQKLSQNAQQAALKRELEPSRLGSALSDTLTRRLIIGVLLLLMVLPAITYNTSDQSHNFGLRQLFWVGRSDCGAIEGDFYCNNPGWTTKSGWQELLRNFVSASRPDEASREYKDVLWMFIPDYDKSGKMSQIQNITNPRSEFKSQFKQLETIRKIKVGDIDLWRNQIHSKAHAEGCFLDIDCEATYDPVRQLSEEEAVALNTWIFFDEVKSLDVPDQAFMQLLNFTDATSYIDLSGKQVTALQSLQRNMFENELYWKQSKECSGPVVSNKENCGLRADEMTLLMYTPFPCVDLTIKNCNELVSYVRIGIKESSQQTAMLQFMTTIFTCFVLATGSLMFQNDTARIVIMPITKMVGIIKTLADDPLQKQDPPQFDEQEVEDKNPNQMKTVELQKTIFRIGNLLQMSFGQLGAVIIRENVSSGDGSLEIMIPGHRISVIFMVARVNYYCELMDGLKLQATEFLNKVINILHQCADKWDGQANRNENDKYLISWKLPETDGTTDNEKNEALMEHKTELADKSLITAVKIVSEMRRAQVFIPYFKRPALHGKFGSSMRPHLTFGLHMGWTIEGAIGSESKIDACYLSPQCQIAYRIEDLCEYFQMQILVTESLYNLMSLKARHTLRKIDVVTMKESREPMGLYTFDLSFNNMDCELIPEDHSCGDLIKLAQFETINIESFKNKGVDYMFTLDSDIVGLQQHIQEFNPIFRQAFKCYIQGEWSSAYENIERCLELWDSDGPTKAMQLYMSYYQFQMPESWTGYRDIDQVISIEEINRNMGLDDEDEEQDVDQTPKQES